PAARVGNVGEAAPVHVLVPGVGDEQLALDGLDVEGHEAVRQVGILEGTGAHDRPEVLVEDVDRAAAEIGGVEAALAGRSGGEGEPRVVGPGRGVIDGQQGAGRIDDGRPAGDGAVLAGEQEAAGGGSAV